jgi:hypothetical protein
VAGRGPARGRLRPPRAYPPRDDPAPRLRNRRIAVRRGRRTGSAARRAIPPAGVYAAPPKRSMPSISRTSLEVRRHSHRIDERGRAGSCGDSFEDSRRASAKLHWGRSRPTSRWRRFHTVPRDGRPSFGSDRGRPFSRPPRGFLSPRDKGFRGSSCPAVSTAAFEIPRRILGS